MTVARGIPEIDAVQKAGDAGKLQELVDAGTVIVHKRNMGKGRNPRVRFEWPVVRAPRPARMTAPEPEEEEDEEPAETIAQ